MPGKPREIALPSSLGPLEAGVLDAVWKLEASGVPARDVREAMAQPLAYTTVTTTLDRLCKKGLLERRMVDRAFLYRALYTRRELEAMEARRAIRTLVDGGLVACLVDAVSEQDEHLLDELEERIRRKREEMKRR